MTTLYNLPQIEGTREETVPLFAHMEAEVWADAYGYKGFYIVSTRGNVISNYKTLEHRMAVHWSEYHQHYTVRLTRPERGPVNVRLHRLVMMTFGEIPQMQYKKVTFKDGNPRNVTLSNLQWSDEALARLSEDQVRAMRLIPHAKYRIREIATDFDVSPETVRDVLEMRTWWWVK